LEGTPSAEATFHAVVDYQLSGEKTQSWQNPAVFPALYPDQNGSDQVSITARYTNRKLNNLNIYQEYDNGGTAVYNEVFGKTSTGNIIINESGGNYDFRVESNNLESAILVDSGDNTISIGSNSTTFSDLPAEAKGTDVKILLSGSAGTKDTTTRGTTLVTGDLVVSGTLYNGAGSSLNTFKYIDNAYFFVSPDENNNKYFIPRDDVIVEGDTIDNNTFSISPYAGRLDKVILYVQDSSNFGTWTVSFHVLNAGSNPANVGSNPTNQIDVDFNPSSNGQFEAMEFDFSSESNATINAKDIYAIGVQPTNNWNSATYGRHVHIVTVFSYDI
jgi:hypothetical protein